MCLNSKITITMKIRLLALLPLIAFAVSCYNEIEPDDPQPSEETGFDFTIPAPEAIPYQFAGASEDYPYIPDGRHQIAPIIASIGSYIAQQAWTAAKNSATSYAKSKATSFIRELLGMDTPSESEQIQIKLDQIISSLDEINDKLDNMYEDMLKIQKQVDEAQINILATQVQALNSKTNLMYFQNLETYSLILEALKQENSDEAIIGIINDWAKTIVNGTEARLNALTYVEDIIDPLSYFTYHERKINILQVYDLTVFDAYPWEYLGYTDRESFRAKVATEAALSLAFAYLYYANENATTMVETCLRGMEKLCDFMNMNTIHYDYDHTRCQIRGAYVLINTSAVWNRTDTGKTLEMMLENIKSKKTWYENEWLFSSFNIAKPSNSSDAITAAREAQLTTEELEAIINYYKKSTPDESLLSIFRKAGIVFPEDFKNDTEIYIGTQKTQTCLWLTNTTSSHSYYSEFSNVYDAGHPVSEAVNKVAYNFYQGVYSFNYPDDWYSATVNVPGFSGKYRHYRRWFLDTQATSYEGPGEHFFFFRTGGMTRYADFNETD